MMTVVPASVLRDGLVMTVPHRCAPRFVQVMGHVIQMEPARVNPHGLQPRIVQSKDVLEIAGRVNVIWRQRNACAIMDTLDYIARERLA